MNSDKKIVVKKTIPRKTMGYLKFALFVLGSNEENIVQKLFLDKSIDEIIASVNDVVEKGDQAKTINDLRKQIINPPKAKKTRTKKVANTDAIVADLVAIARTELSVPKKPRAKKVSKSVDEEKPVDELVDDAEKPVVDDTKKPVNKPRAKKVSMPVVDIEKPVVDTEKPVVDTEKPVVDDEKPVVDTEKPAVDTEKPVNKSRSKKVSKPVDDAEKPVDDTEKPVDDAEKPVKNPRAKKAEKPVDEF